MVTKEKTHRKEGGGKVEGFPGGHFVAPLCFSLPDTGGRKPLLHKWYEIAVLGNKNILSCEYEFWYRLVQQVIASWEYKIAAMGNKKYSFMGIRILVPFGTTGNRFMGIRNFGTVWYRSLLHGDTKNMVPLGTTGH